MADLYEGLYDDVPDTESKPLVPAQPSGASSAPGRAKAGESRAAASQASPRPAGGSKGEQKAQTGQKLPHNLQKALDEAKAAQDSLLREMQSLSSLCSGLQKLTSLADFLPRKEQAMSLRDKVSSESFKRLEAAHATLQRQLRSSASSKSISDDQLTEVTSTANKIASSIESCRKQFTVISAHVTKLFMSRETTLRAQEARENDPEAQAEREADEALAQQVKLVDQDIEDDADAILAIQRDVNDINEMMKQMAADVEAQQETINTIEENVTEAEDRAQSGVKNLESAKKHQRCGKKILLYGGIAVAVLVVILLLVFLL